MTDNQRKKIIELMEAGYTQQEIVKETKLSRGSVYRIIKAYKNNSDTEKLDDFDLEDEDVSDIPAAVSETEPDISAAAESIENPSKNSSPEGFETSEFLKSIELLGQLNRELMQSNSSHFNKATQALEAILDRFQSYDSAGLRSAVEEVNALIAPLQHLSDSRSNLPFRTAVYLIILLFFLFSGILLGICYYPLFTRWTFGVLLFICGILFVLLAVIRKIQCNELFAWITASSLLAPFALFSGYFIGRMEWLVFESWLSTLLLFPVGCIFALPFAIWRRNK